MQNLLFYVCNEVWEKLAQNSKKRCFTPNTKICKHLNKSECLLNKLSILDSLKYAKLNLLKKK